jgi:hypothetical protein
MRLHTIIAVAADGEVARVCCDVCGSQHNYRGARRDADGSPDHGRRGLVAEPMAAAVPRLAAAREGTVSDMATSVGEHEDLERLLRRVIREEAGLSTTAPAERWRGGELVLRPGRPGLQEKKWPIDAFFHKIVMIRNRLRTLEQQVNASDLPEDAKLKLQAYVTGCYGSLTSFNVLFADAEDHFEGSGGE